MTSRANQSVSPPPLISQQRHISSGSSLSPPPQQLQQYYTAPSSIQFPYEFLPPGPTFLQYQVADALSVSNYGSNLNEIRGSPSNNGRTGPITPGYYQPMGAHMRSQQMPQGPVVSQQGYMSSQVTGPYGPPRPQTQPQQQFVYYNTNYPASNNIYQMPAMYGGQPALPVYPQSQYIPSLSNVPSFQNGMQWQNQSMAYTNRQPQQREKKVLDILDPKTGRKVIIEPMDKRTHSADTDEANELVHPVKEKNDICQAFTRQVADRLKSPDEPVSYEAPPESHSTLAGSPAGLISTSQQYQQPQQVHQQHPHPQQQQMQQQQPQPSKGPSQLMRAPLNGPPPPAVIQQHQVIPSLPGLIQQPPTSETPPHDIQPPLLNVNLSRPPPQLPIRQSNQSAYTPAVQHHPQTPQQQQPMRSQMLTALQQMQSHHYTQPQSPPHYTQPSQLQHYTQPNPSQSPHYTQPQTPPHYTQPQSPPHYTQPQSPHYTQPNQPQSPSHYAQPQSPPHYTQPQSPPHYTHPQSPHYAQTHSPPHYAQPQSPPHYTQPQPQSPHYTQPQSPAHFARPQSPHHYAPDTSPHYIQASQSLPHNQPMCQPFQPEVVVDKQMQQQSEALYLSNIPSQPVAQPPRTVSPVQYPSSVSAETDHLSGDLQSNSTAPYFKSGPSLGDGQHMHEDFNKEEIFQATNSQAANNVRKGKKNIKDLNHKDIAGSDMDAFIDKIDKSLDVYESNDTSLNNATVESSPEPAVNGASFLDSVSSRHASFEEDAEAPVHSHDKDMEPRTHRASSSDTTQTDISLENGYSKDNQKSTVSSSQAEVAKARQKKKKKKGHQSPPIHKSKQSTSPIDMPEKKNETEEMTSRTPATTDFQEKSVVQQENTSTRQNKFSFQHKMPPSLDKSVSLQDKSTVSVDKAITSQETIVQGRPDKFLSYDKNISVSSSTPTQTSRSTAQPITSSSQQPQLENKLASTPVTNLRSVEPTRQETKMSGEHSDSVPEQSKRAHDSDVCAVSVKTTDSTECIIGQGNGHIPEMDEDISRKPVAAKKSGKEKLQYDRSYLMELRDCPSSQTKPIGLPDLEIILATPIANSTNRVSLDFTPSFFQPTANMRISSQIGKTNSRSRQRSDMQIPQRIITSVSLQDTVKPLHQSEKPWKPTPKQMSAGEISEKVKTLESDVLFIMNRLTPTNFDKLADEMRKLDIKTNDDLLDLVKIFFDKVTIETKFVEAYAKLCKVMTDVKPSAPTKDSNVLTFRVAMLTKCQQEFEADKTAIFEDPEERKKKIESEMPDNPERAALIEQTLYQMKMRRLKFYGNIRFIGELFKLKMLTENIMHDCISRLLSARDDDSLVSLCNLITTVGQLLDTDKSKAKMDQYFSEMNKIANEQKTRIKFTLKDVIDLRKNNWTPRKEQTAPKKIDEVHKDFHQEQVTKQLLQSQPLPPRLEAAQAKRTNRQRQDDRQMSDDGWNTVGSKSQRIDVTKMRLSKNVVDENNIQLGPGGGMKQFSMWGKGSYGGTQQSQEHDRSPVGSRFSPLKHDDDRKSHQRSPTQGQGDNLRPARYGQISGHNQGRVLSRSSQEGDRRDAPINTRYVSESMSQDSGRDNSKSVLSRDGDNTFSTSHEQQRSLHPTAPAVSDSEQSVKHVKPLSEEEMEFKARTILEEYLSVLDLQEAKTCMIELEGQTHLPLFVSTCINDVLEKSQKERQLAGSFFHEMIQSDLLPLEVYFKGLAQVFLYAEDMMIDIPKIWTYLAEIIVPILDGVSVTWADLRAALESGLEKQRSVRFIVEILLIAKEKTSEQEVAEMWQSSHMDWSSLLESDQVEQFLRDTKLEFTVKSYRIAESSQSGLQKLTEDIESIIRRSGSNEEISSCIHKYTISEKLDKSVIRATVTAIINASLSSNKKFITDEKIRKYISVLGNYLQNRTELELQAIYAIQALMHKLEHPPGLIDKIFTVLFDEEVISEEAIKLWENSTDPHEVEGRGPCRMQLTQFLTWLRENEELDPS